MEDAGEISDILARSYGTPYDVDESELEAELACLGDEFEAIGTEESAPAFLPSVSLPAQPTSSIAAPQSVDEFGQPILYKN